MQFDQAKQFILGMLAEGLPANISYHSLNHTHDVYDAAERLAEEEGIIGEDLQLLLTAVLFHDCGFLSQQKEHERVSCEIAARYLPGFGYTDAQLTRIYGMIMATQIPQTPHNLLEQIICDSDLDYLGRDDFFTIGNKLFTELKVYGMLRDEDDWDQLQIRFLEKHAYFTGTAIRLRQEKKERNLQILKDRSSKAHQ